MVTRNDKKSIGVDSKTWERVWRSREPGESMGDAINRKFDLAEPREGKKAKARPA